MNFKQILLASCAIIISATVATAQIPSYVPTDGLVGWWPFNGNANDESGNGNNGVVNGATLTEDRNGALSSAFYFNGVGNNIFVPYNSILNATSISISGWLRADQLGGVRGLVSRWSQTNNPCSNYSASIDDITNSFVGSSSEYINTVLFTPTPIELNTWYHFVYAHDASSGGALYLNGVELESNDIVGEICESNKDLYFGAQLNINSLWRFFEGKLDDIAIYNRALTPQEIQNLYNGTTETVDTGNGAAPLPQGIPYQAAARDAQGQSLVNAAVNVRFTLHEGAADGAASYAETHALTTNSVGLFNTVFGNGTPEQSAFDSINWAATTKFLQVEIDLGEGYVDMGTTQLLSVPYAFRSDEAARIKNAGLPIFADNAAALAGGLVAGEMYRTASGDLKIVY